jgi:hypothetical protein
MLAPAVVPFAGPRAPSPVVHLQGGSLNVNLDECANKTTPCSWQNGGLNCNNSQYHEGSVVPVRLAVEGLSAGW